MKSKPASAETWSHASVLGLHMSEPSMTLSFSQAPTLRTAAGPGCDGIPECDWGLRGGAMSLTIQSGPQGTQDEGNPTWALRAEPSSPGGWGAPERACHQTQHEGSPVRPRAPSNMTQSQIALFCPVYSSCVSPGPGFTLNTW